MEGKSAQKTRETAHVSGETLTKRILAIQKKEEDINQFIIEYTPFISAVASKVAGKAIQDNSDELAIAQMAFAESIKSYDMNKGKFLTFSRWVMRNRLIDYMRKESRSHCEIVFSEMPDYKVNNICDSRPIVSPIKLEIDALSIDLKKYGIKFKDLVAVSPKARKTKRACAKAIRYMISHPEELSAMKKTTQLPMKKLVEKCMVPRKLVERHRKYIIVVTEIMCGYYPYLKEYVSFVKGGHFHEMRSDRDQ